MICKGARHCMRRGCVECRFRRSGAKWMKAPWGLLDRDDPAKGTWLLMRRSSGGFGIGCQPCARMAKARGSFPPGSRDFVKGTVRLPSVFQASHLKRHADSNFHKLSVKAWLKRGDVDPTAPDVSQFRLVLDHVLMHHGKCSNAHMVKVGGRGKVKRMLLCLAEGCKRQDQRFFKDVQSVALARDARKSRLAIRFVAVNSKLQTRSGLLGLAPDFGTGSAAITRATANLLREFSTKYVGTASANLISGLHTAVRNNVHMITVDAATDEVLSAEMMRKPLLGMMSTTTPNLRIVLRDKAHATRRITFYQHCCRM